MNKELQVVTMLNIELGSVVDCDHELLAAAGKQIIEACQLLVRDILQAEAFILNKPVPLLLPSGAAIHVRKMAAPVEAWTAARDRYLYARQFDIELRIEGELQDIPTTHNPPETVQ